MMLGMMIKFIMQNRLLFVSIKVFLKCYCIMEKSNLLPSICTHLKIKHTLANYLIICCSSIIYCYTSC
jgi:hypothetical protein